MLKRLLVGAMVLAAVAAIAGCSTNGQGGLDRGGAGYGPMVNSGGGHQGHMH